MSRGRVCPAYRPLSSDDPPAVVIRYSKLTLPRISSAWIERRETQLRLSALLYYVEIPKAPAAKDSPPPYCIALLHSSHCSFSLSPSLSTTTLAALVIHSERVRRGVPTTLSHTQCTTVSLSHEWASDYRASA